MRTLVVDDHHLVRSSITQMLEAMSPNTEVVGECANGRDALKMLKELDVELMITDLSMPGISGLNLIKKAVKKKPELCCLVLSMHTSQEQVVSAFQAGACAYVHKNASPEELLVAVQAVEKGAIYLHPAIAGSVVGALRASGGSSDPLDILTERQREILKLIGEGHSTKEMASMLNVSAKTVETHRAQLMERLNTRNIAGLVKIAVRCDLVDLEHI